MPQIESSFRPSLKVLERQAMAHLGLWGRDVEIDIQLPAVRYEGPSGAGMWKAPIKQGKVYDFDAPKKVGHVDFWPLRWGDLFTVRLDYLSHLTGVILTDLNGHEAPSYYLDAWTPNGKLIYKGWTGAGIAPRVMYLGNGSQLSVSVPKKPKSESLLLHLIPLRQRFDTRSSENVITGEVVIQNNYWVTPIKVV